MVRKGGAKEAGDNAHDRLGYISLQRGVRMFPVTGVVAYLGNDREYVTTNRTSCACASGKALHAAWEYSPTQIIQRKKRAILPVARHRVFA